MGKSLCFSDGPVVEAEQDLVKAAPQRPQVLAALPTQEQLGQRPADGVVQARCRPWYIGTCRFQWKALHDLGTTADLRKLAAFRPKVHAIPIGHRAVRYSSPPPRTRKTPVA